MTVSLDQIRHLAKLARLELSEAEAHRMATDLSSILSHMEVLRRVVDGGTSPPAAAVTEAPLRPDRVEFDRLDVPPEMFAPDWQQGHFVVPRLAARDAEVEER